MEWEMGVTSELYRYSLRCQDISKDDPWGGKPELLCHSEGGILFPIFRSQFFQDPVQLFFDTIEPSAKIIGPSAMGRRMTPSAVWPPLAFPAPASLGIGLTETVPAVNGPAAVWPEGNLTRGTASRADGLIKLFAGFGSVLSPVFSEAPGKTARTGSFEILFGEPAAAMEFLHLDP